MGKLFCTNYYYKMEKVLENINLWCEMSIFQWVDTNHIGNLAARKIANNIVQGKASLDYFMLKTLICCWFKSNWTSQYSSQAIAIASTSENQNATERNENC